MKQTPMRPIPVEKRQLKQIHGEEWDHWALPQFDIAQMTMIVPP